MGHANTNETGLIVTLGDPAGIGPEVALKAIARWLRAPDSATTPALSIIGSRKSVETTLPTLSADDREFLADRLQWHAQADVLAAPAVDPTVVRAVDVGGEQIRVTPGRPTAETGACAYKSITTALDVLSARADAAAAMAAAAASDRQQPGDLAAVMAGSLGPFASRIGGLVTAPLSKEALRMADIEYPDHTTILGTRTDRDPIMSFVGGGLRVALATTHMALSAVPLSLDSESLSRLILLASWAMADREGIKPPLRVAVCGLNPHAGEAGMFGTEDDEIIKPAIALARSGELPSATSTYRRGGWRMSDREIAPPCELSISGPWPADSIFWRARHGEFDLVIAMYHDQGLIPVKTLAFHDAVHATLNLPFVRTSPDHGTAFDRAGKGTADSRSMTAALRLAAKWIHTAG